jgi:hypothetical protein
MRTFTLMALVIAAIGLAAPVAAQKPIVYPAKGQSGEQQKKDDGECAAWAKQNTGIDPAAAAAAPPPAPSGAQGERLRGAARGAVGGAVIGEIANDDAGKGAGVGAAAGTMAGGRQARQNKKAAGEQAKAQQAQTLNTYYRAFGACMEGRGYTIK